MGQYAFHPDGRPWDTSYPACGSFYSGSLSHPPLILSGGALNVQDTVVTTIGSQTDMVATVLAQLGMDHSGYKFSRNLLADQGDSFCFLFLSQWSRCSDRKKGLLISVYRARLFVEKDSVKEDGRLLKAYLQAINEDFNRQ